MKARLTLDEVVAHNIKRLRKSRRWTATELAETLTAVVERPYTRFTVYDLEGRRGREIRWVELVALCSIFGVVLWELVIPPYKDEDGNEVEVEVDSLVATGAITGVDYSLDPSDDPVLAAIGGTKAIVWHDLPDRDDLAWLLFGLDKKTLDADVRQKHTKKHKDRVAADLARAVIEAGALLQHLDKSVEQSPTDPTDNDQKEEGH